MKNLSIIPLLLTIILLIVSFAVSANDPKYIEAMQKHIQSVYAAKTIEELQASVNSFERIANVEKTRWEPNYYAAFGYIMMANREKEPSKKDQYLDLALTSIEKAKAINASESEIVALEGFAYMIRVTVDPPSRGPQFSGLAMQTYHKAIALNAQNPRAYALLGQMQYGTAQFFGSSTNEACENVSKALANFDTYKSEDPLAPQWGRQMAEGLKAQCK